MNTIQRDGYLSVHCLEVQVSGPLDHFSQGKIPHVFTLPGITKYHNLRYQIYFLTA